MKRRSGFVGWRGARIASVIVLAAITAVSALWLFRAPLLGVDVFLVVSHSMSPSLRPGGLVLVDLHRRRASDLRRCDIVAFRHVGRVHVKRVVGVSGDEITARDGRLQVNGAPSTCSAFFGEEARAFSVPAQHLSDDELFVLGDNLRESVDSRRLGAVVTDDIIGRVVADADDWVAVVQELATLIYRRASSAEPSPVGG